MGIQRSTMTASEAAQYLGVSERTIRQMVHDQQIPHIRVRRRLFFRRETLDEWMRQQERLQLYKEALKNTEVAAR